MDTAAPDVRINVHMHRTEVSIALDLSGDSLHKRGYRAPGTGAPIKENLAAAILLRGDWPALAAAGGGFCDPMCGSGTLAIEAAWIAGDSAPGLLRTRFGFQRWRGHDDAAWKALLDEALERQEAGLARIPPIVAFDHDPAEVRFALQNVQRAGLAGHVHVERRELSEARPPKNLANGLIRRQSAVRRTAGRAARAAAAVPAARRNAAPAFPGLAGDGAERFGLPDRA